MNKEKKSIIRGRFSKALSEKACAFSASHETDRKMYEEDIKGSLAHAKMLCAKKIISANELKSIQQGLDKIKKEIEAKKFVFDNTLEDIHMHIESRLIELTGDAGQKLHTGRSRNDQVILDFKLFCRKEADVIIKLLDALMKVLLNQAVKHKNIMMPGYTHLQQAQVVIAAQHFLAYINMFDRDKSRLNDCLKRMDFCPLGVGAIAGTGLGNDRMMVAKELGFKNVTDNSLDTVADRDFALELLFCISLIALHLSRFSEEIIIWYTSEFDFIELDETWCTGSSLMPQKSNPDIAELIRGKTGKFLGNLVNLYTTVKGLPLTYNRDLQEDKEGVFSSICNIKNCLSVFTDMIASLKIKDDILKRQKDDYMLATDMAEYLVKKALPFRKAHHVVGSIVRYAGENNLKLADLSLEKFKEFSPLFDKTIFNFLKLEKSADFKNTFGSTSSREVIRQINRWKKILNSNKKGN